MKTGVRLHAQVATFLSHIPCPHLWLGKLRALLSADPEGEGVAGATPPFCGSCVPVPPFQVALRGYRDAPQMGGRSRHSDPCRKA